MSVLSAQTIVDRIYRSDVAFQPEGFKFIIDPFVEQPKQACGMSYGLTGAGYDIRIGRLKPPEPHKFKGECHSWLLQPGEFMLAASLERFELPSDIQAIVHDKSTLARQGVALQNTVLEPGWEGYITLELSNHGPKPVRILVGQPIAQVVFHQLDRPTDRPYRGNYQNQDNLPTPAKFVGDKDQAVEDLTRETLGGCEKFGCGHPRILYSEYCSDHQLPDHRL